MFTKLSFIVILILIHKLRIFYFAEYDSNFKMVEKQEFKIPDHMMIHDWAFTDTYYIVFANRIKLDILG